MSEINWTCRQCGRGDHVRPSLLGKRFFCTRFCHNFYLAALVPLSERFSFYVERAAPGECWRWKGARDKKGYGRFRTKLAHRVAWKIDTGAEAGKLYVLHRCDNPSCVNPAHLFLGTHADNMADMVAKGRQRAGPGVPRGTSQKLDAAAVQNIRELVTAGQSQAEVAARYGLNPSAVSRIVRRESWAI